jgi:hypothetical protein
LISCANIVIVYHPPRERSKSVNDIDQKTFPLREEHVTTGYVVKPLSDMDKLDVADGQYSPTDTFFTSSIHRGQPSMERYDDCSDDSCEYWSSGDASENEGESETNEEITTGWLMEYLIAKCQMSHSSSGYTTSANTGGDRAPASSSGKSRQETPSTNSRSSQGKKRERSRNQHHDEDEDQKKRRSLEQVISVTRLGRSSRLACPFFKRTPLKYPWEACVGPGFVDMIKLK